jgi:putative membrane protein (TIGR04086 family)
MGKTRKQTAVWMVFLQGIALASVIYLGAVLLAALLAVKGALPERNVFPVIAAACVLAAMAGGLRCVWSSPIGRLPSGLLCSAGFGVALLGVGLLCWEGGVTWTGRGGILLLCVLAGGVLAGLLGGKRGRRVKRKMTRK